MLKSANFRTAVMRLPGSHMTTTSLPACSFSAVTYIIWSRGTLEVYDNNSTSCDGVIFLYYARESCVLGRRKSFLRKQVAIVFVFKTENWCAATQVVNLNRNTTIGTQEQYETAPKSRSR